MKYLFALLLGIVFATTAMAQDTLKKVLEYDVRIEDAAKLDVPWLPAYITALGKKSWVEKLFGEMAAGTRSGYENHNGTEALGPEWFAQGLSGHTDTIYVVDPVELTEEMQFIEREPWDLRNIVGVRIRRTEYWTDDKGNSMVDFQLALLYDYTDKKGNYRGRWAIFWIYIN